MKLLHLGNMCGMQGEGPGRITPVLCAACWEQGAPGLPHLFPSLKITVPVKGTDPERRAARPHGPCRA